MTFGKFVQQMNSVSTKTVMMKIMLIMVSITITATILTLTIIRFKKQLDHDQLAKFQLKTIKWLYIACLAVFPITMLIATIAAAIKLVELFTLVAYIKPIVISNIATLMLFITILSMFIMAWILPACDKAMTKIRFRLRNH